MVHTKNLDENLDDFNKLALDLANCNEKITNEHHAVILIKNLFDPYKEIKNVIKYGRETLTTEIVVNY